MPRLELTTPPLPFGDEEEAVLILCTDLGSLFDVSAADDQTDGRVTVLTHVVLAEGVQLVAHEVVDVAAIGQLLILEILCAAVGGAAEDEHPLALLLCVGQIGADGVQTHVGSQRDKVGLKVAGEVAHGVHLSGLGDVAALDVGDDRHTGLADSLQGVGIGLQTLEAQRLVVSDLHLVAARDGLGGVDELLVEADDVLALGEGAVHEICGQVAEIGVQTHADRAACFNCFVKLIHVRHFGVPPVCLSFI